MHFIFYDYTLAYSTREKACKLLCEDGTLHVFELIL